MCYIFFFFFEYLNILAVVVKGVVVNFVVVLAKIVNSDIILNN
jgi:hypothetical protein